MREAGCSLGQDMCEAGRTSFGRWSSDRSSWLRLADGLQGCGVADDAADIARRTVHASRP